MRRDTLGEIKWPPDFSRSKVQTPTPLCCRYLSEKGNFTLLVLLFPANRLWDLHTGGLLRGAVGTALVREREQQDYAEGGTEPPCRYSGGPSLGAGRALQSKDGLTFTLLHWSMWANARIGILGSLWRGWRPESWPPRSLIGSTMQMWIDRKSVV